MFFAGNLNAFWGGCGHMVVGFTTTYTMTGWGFPPGVLRFPPPIKLTACN